MKFTTKPTWLIDTEGLQDLINFHLYLPQDAPSTTSLQDSTAFNRGLKEYLYWKGQLLPSVLPNVIFLSFLGPNGLMPINIINVTTALQAVCDLTKVVEFHQGANTHFLAVSFSDNEQIKNILEKFKYFEDTVVLPVYKDSSNSFRFRLLWLPPLFDISRVHHLLKRYTKDHRIKREFIPIVGGAYAPTNVISGTLTLEAGEDVCKLPHLIQLPSPHKGCALLSIPSRPPLCLKCRVTGHTRSQCSMIKCTKCTKVHFPEAICGTSSYAEVMHKNITTTTQDDWISRLSDDSTSINDDPSSIACNPVLDQLPSVQPLISSSDSSSHNFSSPLPSDMPNTFSDIKKCDRTHAVSTGGDAAVSVATPSVTLATVSMNVSMTPIEVTGARSKSTKHKADYFTPETALSDNFDESDNSVSADKYKSMANYSKKRSSSKVWIASQENINSVSSRSLCIPYNTPHDSLPDDKLSSSVNIDLPFSGSLFDEPEQFDDILSDSDSKSETFMCVDIPDANESDFLAIASTSGITALTNPNISYPDLSSTLSSTNKSKSVFNQQITSLFKISVEQASFLEDLCPVGCHTADTIKVLKLLLHQGFTYDHIIGSPHVLRLRFHEAKRKIKFLTEKMGSFSIEDLWRQDIIEYKFNTGSILTPSGSFHA